MTRRVVWVTRDGTRQVEPISLDGRPVLLVTDPRYAAQPPDVMAYLPVRTVTRGGHEVLAPSVTAELARRGIDLATCRELRAS